MEFSWVWQLCCVQESPYSGDLLRAHPSHWSFRVSGQFGDQACCTWRARRAGNSVRRQTSLKCWSGCQKSLPGIYKRELEEFSLSLLHQTRIWDIDGALEWVLKFYFSRHKRHLSVKNIYTLFEKSNFCPKIQFWQNPNIFTSFSPNFFFFDNFSREIKVVNS